jgi:hypothetical protein
MRQVLGNIIGCNIMHVILAKKQLAGNILMVEIHTINLLAGQIRISNA